MAAAADQSSVGAGEAVVLRSFRSAALLVRAADLSSALVVESLFDCALDAVVAVVVLIVAVSVVALSDG